MDGLVEWHYNRKFDHKLMKSCAGPAIYGGIFDVPTKLKELEELESRTAEPGFWDNQTKAQKFIGEMNRIKDLIGPVEQFQAKVDDFGAMAELVDEAGEDDGAELVKELEATATALLRELDDIEIRSFLTGPRDSCNAFLTVHSGAGGTESCDWAEMLFRMYCRWAEGRGFGVEIQDIQQGDEAGITSATILVSGPLAYGFCKAERGVHRLVRISPFDSNKRRHTSFASVDVIAEIEDDDAEVVVRDEDVRIDTYRASGKGGQHVNKTDSAVRITHLATGIVVTCQNERSQIKNRVSAMRNLKARLYEKQQDDKRAEMDKFYGEKGEISWGNQIRSYVFQPYQMVKDLRTGVESGNIQAVMDGGLDDFVNGWLRAGCPTARNKETKVEV